MSNLLLPAVFVFIFGAIIGSFLNVVIYRFNTGRSLGGRSTCPVCTKTLHWPELLPIVSFIFLRARCRACRAKISWQYPLVEFLTAALFLAIFLWQWPQGASLGLGFKDAPWGLLFWWIIMAILVVITVYDLRHKIIPDFFVYSLILLALGRLFFLWQGRPLLWDHLLAGLGLFAFFALLWAAGRGRWMGFGDAKLALAVGLLLGPVGGISAIIFAFWSGALAGIALLLLNKRYTIKSGVSLKSEIPFAPFIIFGFLLNLLCGLNLFSPIF